jgi:hypothetical protein
MRIGRDEVEMTTSHPRRQPAGKVDPVGAAAADKSKTDDCVHPLASTLANLHCTYCGVFILDGRVLDQGRGHKRHLARKGEN